MENNRFKPECKLIGENVTIVGESTQMDDENFQMKME